MPDLTELLGAGIFAAGLLAGRYMPARRKGPKPRDPVCGCGHDLAHHEPDGDGGGTRCHMVSQHYNGFDHMPRYTEIPCTCKQYTGPRVLDPGYVARELTEGA